MMDNLIPLPLGRDLSKLTRGRSKRGRTLARLLPPPPPNQNPEISSFHLEFLFPRGFTFDNSTKMADRLDMSLDDLIKSNKRGVGNTRGARPGQFSGPGPSRRLQNRPPNRAAPYSMPFQAPDASWQHDMFMQGGAAFPAWAAPVPVPAHPQASSIETGTKLYISNLDYGVTNEDIKELFSEVGDLKRYGIHYDKSGRSKGTAEVVFSQKADAFSAVKRYNGVQLDGKPMQIEIVGTNIATAPAVPVPGPFLHPAMNGTFSNRIGPARSGQGRGGFGPRGRGRDGGRGGARRGRGGIGTGRGRGRDEKVSADDLDAELEKYHKAAMETVE